MNIEQYLSSSDIEMVQLGLVMLEDQEPDKNKRRIMLDALVKRPLHAYENISGKFEIIRLPLGMFNERDNAIMVKDPTRILKLVPCTKK